VEKKAAKPRLSGGKTVRLDRSKKTPLSLKPIRRRSTSNPIIDFHAHIVVPEVRLFSQGHVVNTSAARDSGAPPDIRAATKKWVEEVEFRISDHRERLRIMDTMGVDIQVLTPSLVHQYTYWADPAISLAMEQLTNNRIAETVAIAPNRFIGLGGVPLQAPDLAIRELERCMGELGFKGVEISSHAEGMELGDSDLRPFWEAVVRLDALVYLHPAGVASKRYARHQIWNSIGQPLEEALAMISLIYDGVMDDYPGLKICIAHGGGYLPFYAGRVDHNYRDKPFTLTRMTKVPSDYMRENFWYDTCLYNVDMLENLVRKVGASRIVLGSDYPVGENDPVGFVRSAKSLSRSEQSAILGGNGARLLGFA
jgi:aminocarboxymuconate-semialdehyde decarboxylase